MEKKTKRALFIIGIMIITILLVTTFIIKTSYHPSGIAENESYLVMEIINGETFAIDNGEYVRLIGIKAPEEGENFYNESADFLKSLIFFKEVILESDKEDKDNYGTLLRYAYLDYGNGTVIQVNREIVENGYAKPVPVYPNFRYRLDLEQAWQTCLTEKINICS
jgi:endonuclease YncB( thermonuclease family)